MVSHKHRLGPISNFEVSCYCILPFSILHLAFLLTLTLRLSPFFTDTYVGLRLRSILHLPFLLTLTLKLSRFFTDTYVCRHLRTFAFVLKINHPPPSPKQKYRIFLRFSAFRLFYIYILLVIGKKFRPDFAILLTD